MQQSIHSVKNLTEYNSAFKNKIIPSKEGEYYYEADNIKFTDTLDNVASQLILVDSSARNWDKEASNDYTIYLNDKLQYVHSIELLDGRVPASGYIITEHNNTLHFQEDSETLVYAAIPPGNYDVKDLLRKLAEEMHHASPNHREYHFKFNSRTNKVTISSEHRFTLIFAEGTEVVGDRGFIETLTVNQFTGRKELQKVETSNSRNRYIANSIGRILGFYSINLEGSHDYTGQMVYNLRPQQYLAIFINTENHDDFKNVIAPSPDNGADGAFAVIGLCEASYVVNQVVDNARYLKNFNPPIHFSKIRVQFRTMDGQLYDFNGQDHYLLLEVKYAFGREIIKNLSAMKM